MLKIIKLLITLIIASFCCACINSVAVNKLNRIAKEYEDMGDINTAISRLEASVELDEKNYQTRYNLSTLLYNEKKCDKAYENSKFALALIDKEPAIYYLHGLNSICYAKNIKKDFDFKSEKKQQLYKTLLKETTDNLSLYVKILPNSENTQYALNIINEAKELAQETN